MGEVSSCASIEMHHRVSEVGFLDEKEIFWFLEDMKAIAEQPKQFLMVRASSGIAFEQL